MVFRRRRNQALLVVLGCVPILIAVAIKISGGDNGGNGDAGALFGSITTTVSSSRSQRCSS